MGSQVVPRMSESTMRQLVRLVRALIGDVIA